MKKISREKRRRIMAALIFAVVFLLAVWIFNNFTLKITETSFVTDKVSSPVTLAVLSDFHASPIQPIRRSDVLEKIKKINPDAVIILGDMYTRNSDKETIGRATNLMKSIVNSGYTVFFITGDHDISKLYVEDLKKCGVHVMNYAEETVELNGNRIHIMGVNNMYYSKSFTVSEKFSNDSDSLNILLAHIPNYGKFADFGAEITLCGDTHGGIVQLPLLGAAFDPLTKTYLPKIFSKEKIYDKGWFEYEGGAMFITSGIGAYPIIARFNNRPEVVSIKIIPEG